MSIEWKQKKVAINFKLPAPLFEEMMQAVISEGYGMRGKSRWIAEAVEEFLEFEDYVVFVEKEAAVTLSLKKAQTITVPVEFEGLLSKAVFSIRERNLMLEGVKSRIIRAAIMQRLLRK